MDWRSQIETFMPHGMCFLWRPELMSLHIISDALIALAYFSIPIAILRFVRGRDDLSPKHQRLAMLFAAFIAFCGMTHVLSIVVLWVPIYIIEGWLKAATAIISVATAGWLFALIPQALKLPSMKKMENEIAAHRITLVALDAAREALTANFERATDDLRIAEQELLHASRRSAMGDMASTIAHEMNQPLAACVMYLSGSLSMLKKDGYEGPLVEALLLAKGQCLRAGEIIRRVRSFVSGSEDVKRPEQIPLVVDGACGLALMGTETIGVSTSIVHVDSDLPALVDKIQIEQVIVNLVRNALDAMGSAKGSALRVSTDYGWDGMALVSVADNGPGIYPGIGSRLFEPFVSTKGVKGMGVGLAICRTIIENHGGKIWADQNVGPGATVRFTLPLLNRSMAA